MLDLVKNSGESKYK